MRIFYALLFLLFITSCTTRLHYVGSFTQSRQVDVFVDQSTIEKPYTIIRKGYVNPGTYSFKYVKRIQPLAVAKAKQKGADAILIQDYDIPVAATDVHTVFRADSGG